MAKTPEVKVKEAIDKELFELRTAHWVKPIGGLHATSGVSDILVCYRGRFFAIEAKTQKNAVPSELQKKFLLNIMRCGGAVAVVDESNVDGLADWMREVVDWKGEPLEYPGFAYLNRPDALDSKVRML